MCGSGTPGYVPPVANFDGESTDGVVIGSNAPVNKVKKGNHAEEQILYFEFVRANKWKTYPQHAI